MSARWNRRGTLAFGLALLLLVACCLWQAKRLQAAQLAQKQVHYAERLRAAQLIVENEMLAAAYLTSSQPRTRERARHHLERSPK